MTMPREGDRSDASESRRHADRPAWAMAAEMLPEMLSYEMLQLRIDNGKLRSELDVAERRAAELAHRNRNLLMVVEALIRRAFSTAPDLAVARAMLEGLPARLAESHAAEARGEADLGRLAAATLAGFEVGPGGSVMVEGGPAVELVPAARRILALVLFELATNAVKHGALALAGGEARLAWDCAPGAPLRLIWRERGGPPAPAATRRGGGTTLFDALRREYGGTLTVAAEAGERRVEIDLPARQVLRCTPVRDRRRALVVDDNALIAGDLAEMLADRGFGEVVVALDAVEAGQHLARGPFDVVFLDVMLGAERSDALLGAAAPARVVVVSGMLEEELPTAYRGLPLLPKPYGPREVAAVLDGADGRAAG